MKVCTFCGSKHDRLARQCPYCKIAPKIIDGYTAFSPDAADSAESFNTDYFEELADLEAGNFWFRSRNRLIIWALNRYFPDADSFLEIGCGTGFVLSEIENARPQLALYGSDLFITGLKFAAKRVENAELFQMNALQIPFEGEYALVGAFDVLEHIEQDELVLKQMFKATKHGGGIILTVPQHPFLWSKADEFSCHVRRYRGREMRGRVERAGFDEVKTISFISYLLPLVIISRLKMRFNKSDYNIMDELRIGGVMNAIMEKVLDIERGMIKTGCGLPFGSSMLLVARKF